MDNIYKFVDFNKYCPLCKHKDESEFEAFGSACYDCLDEPVNTNSHKPVKFEEEEKD